jgi:hypothetical protein
MLEILLILSIELFIIICRSLVRERDRIDREVLVNSKWIKVKGEGDQYWKILI